MLSYFKFLNLHTITSFLSSEHYTYFKIKVCHAEYMK